MYFFFQKVVSVQDKDRGNCSKFAVDVFDDPYKICHPIPPFGWFLDDMGFSICRLGERNVIYMHVLLLINVEHDTFVCVCVCVCVCV